MFVRCASGLCQQSESGLSGQRKQEDRGEISRQNEIETSKELERGTIGGETTRRQPRENQS